MLLQGVPLYVSGVQPTAPDIQFDQSMLMTKEGAFQQGKSQAERLYGSLLNAAVTRDDSAAYKAEYMDQVTKALKKIGSVDFSIKSNLTEFKGLMDGIYSNKAFVKDIVWTQRFNDQMGRAEALRNCIDPEKCGGAYWDEGVRAMEYQREAFRKASSSEIFGMQDPEYVPYHNVMDQAIEKLKASGLNVTYDAIENGYVVTTKNGERLRTPMTTLFQQTLGSDPKYVKMFETKAFVDRMDWVRGQVAQGNYASEEEATVNYLQAVNRRNSARFDDIAKGLNVDLSYLDQTIESLQEDLNSGEILEGSEQHQRLQNLLELRTGMEGTNAYLEQLRKTAATGNQYALSAMAQQVDTQNAFALFDNEIAKAVDVLQFKDYSVTVKADEFAKIRLNHENEKELEQIKFGHSVYLENLDAENTRKLEEVKKKNVNKDFKPLTDFKNAMTAAEKPYNDRIVEEFRKQHPSNPNLGLKDWEAAKKDPNKKPLVDAVRAAVNEDLKKDRLDANQKAIAAGKRPPFLGSLTRSMFDSEQLLSVTGKSSTELMADAINSMYDRTEDDKKRKALEKNGISWMTEYSNSQSNLTITEFINSKLQ